MEWNTDFFHINLIGVISIDFSSLGYDSLYMYILLTSSIHPTEVFKDTFYGHRQMLLKNFQARKAVVSLSQLEAILQRSSCRK